MEREGQANCLEFLFSLAYKTRTGNKGGASAFIPHMDRNRPILHKRNQQVQEMNTLEMTDSRNDRNFRIDPSWLTLANLLLFLMIFAACGQDSGPAAKQVTAEAEHITLESETLAPDFTLPDLNGTQVSLSHYKGKVVLLNFWATWCPPCRLEMPTMEEAYRNYKTKGFEVVAVSVDAGPKSAIQHFLQELDLSFQVLRDPHMETLRTFRSSALPTTVVIDRRGIIRWRELGYRDWTDPESTKLIKDLLGERAS